MTTNLTRRQRIKLLEADRDRWKAVAVRNYDLVHLQADLLDTAGDIFEQMNMRGFWERQIDRRIGAPTRIRGGVAVYENGTVPTAVAHQQEAHDTITAQSGLSVHEPAYPSFTMSLGEAGAAERT